MFKPVQITPRQFDIQIHSVNEKGVVILTDNYRCSIYDFDRYMSFVLKNYPHGKYLIRVQELIHWEEV